MEFCSKCDNLLYFRCPNDNVLEKHCRKCDFVKTEQSTKSFKVTSTMYSEDDLLYLQFKNKYLRFDPTLPRVRDASLRCPNKECTGPAEKSQILYVKYHPTHMKFLYCCDYCGTMWRQEQTEKMM